MQNNSAPSTPTANNQSISFNDNPPNIRAARAEAAAIARANRDNRAAMPTVLFDNTARITIPGINRNISNNGNRPGNNFGGGLGNNMRLI